MDHNKEAPKTFCTTREAAGLLRVSLRTAQLWTESGLLEAWKTEGGHRRISRLSVDRLLDKTDKSVTLPPVLEQKSLPEQSPAQAPVKVPALEPLKILVVEDDPSLRRLYQINMRRWKMQPQVGTADDGYEGLIRVGREMPDLLIADLQMQGMNGFSMLYAICSMPELAEMKIIVVSGLDKEEIAQRGGVPQSVPIFPKPIPFDEIRVIAEQIVAERNLFAG